MANLRSLPLCVLAGALMVSSVSHAQATAQAPRIVAPIDENQLVTLTGNVHPAANQKNDRGPVSASMPMPDLTLVLSRSPEQQAAFDAYVQSEYDSGSPNYHQWLTPAEIGERFGPSEADIATISAWLGSHGFTVTQVPSDRMTIRFSGTASQVESTFHTSIHNLDVKGAAHYANMSNPQIPAALAPVVVGIKALHNFLPHPLHREGSRVQFNKSLNRWQRVASTVANATPNSGSAGSRFSFASPGAASKAAARSAFGPHPLFGINVPANPTEETSAYLEEDVTPWDFATMYNVAPLWSAATPINGTGQTIAIAGTSEIDQNDVTTFRSLFGLPALSGFQQIDTNGLATECNSTNPDATCGIGDLEENTLDTEWSGAVAPGAKIVLVVTGQNSAGSVDTVYDSAQYVVQNQTAKILNVSYGECELGQGTAENVAIYDLWQSAAAEGISVFVATGDSGSPSCDEGGDSIGNPYSAQYGLTVSGLASTPYNVAVGGTDFSWCKPTIDSSGNLEGCPTSSSSQGSPAYWNTSNNTSSEPYESAAGYVPEIPWNDTCANPILASYIESLATNYIQPQLGGPSAGSNPEAACNYIQNNWANIDAELGIMLAPYVDTIGGSGGASNCVANDEDTNSSNPTCTAGATTTGSSNGNITLVNDGWPKPSWQSTVTGIPNDGVRDLPDVSFFAGDGALDSAYLVCVSAIGSCSYSDTSENAAEEFGGTSFASPAMAGVMALINQKAGAPQGLPNKELYALAAKQTYSECSAETVKNTSTSCYFQSIDEGTNSMPCDLGAPIGGAVYEDGSWEEGEEYPGIDSPNCAALNAGDTVGTLVSSGTTPGYNAATGYNLATGLGSLNVANVVNAWTSDAGTATATMNITTTPPASSGTITLASGVALVIDATVTGGSGTPTGTISATGGGYNTSGTLSAGAVTITIPAGSLAPGSDTLTVTYSGDGTYASTTQTFTVNAAVGVATVTVTAPKTGNTNNAVAVSVGVTGAGSTPTGTVTLTETGGAYNSPAVTLSSGGTASFTIPIGDLPAGSDTITATYSGSATYGMATGTAQITMVSTALLTPTVSVAASPTSIDTSQTLSVTVTVGGTTGNPTPTGSITVTSSAAVSADSAGWSSPLTAGAATITIPAYALNAGTDTLSAAYSGDAVYSIGTPGTASVTVTASAYTLAASAATPSSVAPGASATSTITGNTSTTDYSGTVTLNTCTVTTSPASAVNLPTCTVTGSITYASGTATGSGTATVFTTSNTAMLDNRPEGKGWLGAGGGAVLAFLVFLGIPGRRRSWRAMLGLVALLVGLGSLTACGGGSVNTTTSTATSPGAYTFTVSGTGNDPASTAGTGTFSVTVN
jgi:subtilase family serine protease